MINMSMRAMVLMPTVQFGNVTLETTVSQSLDIPDGASEATIAEANADLQKRLHEQVLSNLTVQREGLEKFTKDFYRMSL